ncbi:MAG: hypothetical protein QXF49_02235 [Thermosphaera sp.]
MTYDIPSIMKEIIKSPKPFEKIDELDINENLKAFLRRKILEDVYGISLPSISSTITDFAENKEYFLLKPLGSVEKPVGYLGRVKIKTSDGIIEPHLLVTWILGKYMGEIHSAVKALEAQEIIATSREEPIGSPEVAFLKEVFPGLKKTRVDLELFIDSKGLNKDIATSMPRVNYLLKIYNEIFLSEIYSLLEIPAILASSSRIEHTDIFPGRDSFLQIQLTIIIYFIQPHRNLFTDEILNLLQVKKPRDLPLIISAYSLLAFLSLLIKERIILA